jgi:hypothetical protein
MEKQRRRTYIILRGILVEAEVEGEPPDAFATVAGGLYLGVKIRSKECVKLEQKLMNQTGDAIGAVNRRDGHGTRVLETFTRGNKLLVGC